MIKLITPPVKHLYNAISLPGTVCYNISYFCADKTIGLAHHASSFLPEETQNTCREYYLRAVNHYLTQIKPFCLRTANHYMTRIKPLIHSSPLMSRLIVSMISSCEPSYSKKIALRLSSLLLRIIIALTPYFPSLKNLIAPESLLGSFIASSFDDFQAQLAEKLMVAVSKCHPQLLGRQLAVYTTCFLYEYAISSLAISLCNAYLPLVKEAWGWTEDTVTWAHRGLIACTYGPPVLSTAYQCFQMYHQYYSPIQQLVNQLKDSSKPPILPDELNNLIHLLQENHPWEFTL